MKAGVARVDDGAARIRRLLHSRHAQDRLRAIEESDRLDSADAPALLVEALRDPSSYIGAAAARVLSSKVDSTLASALVEHFLWASEDGPVRDPGCQVRSELAVILGNLAHAPAEDALRTGIRTVQVEMVGMALDDTAVGLRANCALSLAQLRRPACLLDISQLLFDTLLDSPFPTDTLVARRAAARAIGALGDPAGLVPLVLRLRGFPNEDPDVIVDSLNAVVALDQTGARNLVEPFLASQNSFVAAGAAMALGRTRDPSVLPALLARLDAAPSGLLDVLALAVAAVRAAESRAALLERSSRPERTVRAACARALVSFPDQDVIRRLNEMAAEDPSSQVREAARQSLEAV